MQNAPSFDLFSQLWCLAAGAKRVNRQINKLNKSWKWRFEPLGWGCTLKDIMKNSKENVMHAEKICSKETVVHAQNEMLWKKHYASWKEKALKKTLCTLEQRSTHGHKHHCMLWVWWDRFRLKMHRFRKVSEQNPSSSSPEFVSVVATIPSSVAMMTSSVATVAAIAPSVAAMASSADATMAPSAGAT